MSELLWRIVDSVRYPLLVTTDRDGYPAARPMHLVERDGRLFWFATRAGSAKVEQIRSDPRVTLVFSRPDLFNYASVHGRAETGIGDAAMRRSLWRDEWLDQWPLGPEDPDYLLLRVTGERATFYYGYMDRHERVEL